MKKTILVIVILGLLQPIRGTPLKIEPFDHAFGRFNKTYIDTCDAIVHDIRKQLSVDLRNQPSESFDALERYAKNIRDDEIPAVQAILHKQSEESLAYWCKRLNSDLVGFRQVLDRIIILSLAEKRLQADPDLLQKLQKFWDDQEYFSWRFAYEIAIERTNSVTGLTHLDHTE